jgi:AcrR family transcriptional regulator
MPRAYTLKRRAEQQADTRRRIVDAAVALHASVGPALTTYSMLAEKAGVQRHTLYAHFPDEWSLLLACSASALEHDPLPDAEPWRALPQGPERLRTGLAALYAWYARNTDLAACILRDAEHHEPTQRIIQLRFGPHFGAYHEILGDGLADASRALLHLAIGYFTWRALVGEAGLSQNAAVAAMVQAITAQPA